MKKPNQQTIEEKTLSGINETFLVSDNGSSDQEYLAYPCYVSEFQKECIDEMVKSALSQIRSSTINSIHSKKYVNKLKKQECPICQGKQKGLLKDFCKKHQEQWINEKVEINSSLEPTQQEKTNWEKEWKLKFNEVLNRMYNLEILPELQSRINERIPNIGGWKVFESQELESFIRSLLTQSRLEGRREVLERVKLETDVCVCKCGEKWSETDLADYVNEELSIKTKI